MSISDLFSASAPDRLSGEALLRPDLRSLRALVVAAGLGWALAFVVLGLACDLQLYGDGAIFSYAVAVQDSWAFHWHNIPARLSVYVISHLPAEIYVGLSGDAAGGIVIYGFLFFASPLLGLGVTYVADRSPARIFFTAACLSTAVLCPLVFAFPTEMWMAHAMFWPALAVCHGARDGIGGIILVFAALLALVLTHEGALVFAFAILATVAMRGLRDALFARAAGALLAAVAVWGAVKTAFTPDDYIAGVLGRAALNFIDLANLDCSLCLLLLATLTGYGAALLVVRHLAPARMHVYAVLIVAAALVVYWLGLDHAIHAQYRYLLRTALLFVTPPLGVVATLFALVSKGRLNIPPAVARQTDTLAQAPMVRAAAGAIVLVMLLHAVETAKFVTAWTHYEMAVRDLATGASADPTLGDSRFVSSERIGADLNRLAWSSTTPYLSVLVAPGLALERLVVDPSANYFWLPCRTATANAAAVGAVPTSSRQLVRIHACLHR